MGTPAGADPARSGRRRRRRRPSTLTDLTTASQRRGFISNGAMNAINPVGEALGTLARKH